MSVQGRRAFFGKLARAGGVLAAAGAVPAAAQSAVKRFVKRDAAERSGYSQAVVTQGGRTIWLAGHAAGVDATGKSLAGDLDALRSARCSPIWRRRSRRRAASSPTW